MMNKKTFRFHFKLNKEENQIDFLQNPPNVTFSIMSLSASFTIFFRKIELKQLSTRHPWKILEGFFCIQQS